MKKLIFRDKEFEADKIVKTEKSIIFYNKNNVEINRLQPINLEESYVVQNENGTTGEFDTDEFNKNVITTGTDVMRLLYAIMKENSLIKEEISKLKGGNL